MSAPWRSVSIRARDTGKALRRFPRARKDVQGVAPCRLFRPFSSIQTVTVGTGISPVLPCPTPDRARGLSLLGEHRRWGLAPRPENVTDSKNAPPPCQGGPDRRTGRPDARPLHLAIPSGLPPGHGIAGKPASERRPRVRQAALAGMPACAGRRRLPWG